MARPPKPWFRKARNAWYVTLDGKTIKLGDEKESAFAYFHQLMASRYVPRVSEASASSPSVSPDSSISDNGITVGEVVEKYLDFVQRRRATATYENKNRLFSKWLGENKPVVSQRIVTFKPYQLQEWVDKQPPGGATYTHMILSAIQTCFRWAKKQGLIDDSIIDDLEKPTPKKREEYATPEDYKFLLDYLKEGDPFRDLIVFSWETGCRPQETKAITKDDIDFEKGQVVMENTKAKGPRIRTIMLSDEAIKVAKKYAHNETGPIFLNKIGNPWNKDSVNCRFQSIKKKTGRKLCQLMFRHGFATDLLINDVDMGTVASLMGHVGTRMVSETYGHLQANPEFLRNKLKNRTSNKESEG